MQRPCDPSVGSQERVKWEEGMEKRMEIEQLSPSSVDDHDGHHRNRSGSAVP